jgi:hypothetical protein
MPSPEEMCVILQTAVNHEEREENQEIFERD